MEVLIVSILLGLPLFYFLKSKLIYSVYIGLLIFLSWMGSESPHIYIAAVVCFITEILIGLREDKALSRKNYRHEMAISFVCFAFIVVNCAERGFLGFNVEPNTFIIVFVSTIFILTGRKSWK